MEIINAHLLSELRKLAHNVLAVVSGWNDGIYPKFLTTLGIPFVEVKLGRLYRTKPLWTLDSLINIPSAARCLRESCADFEPDVIVHTNEVLFHLARRIVPGGVHVFHLHNLPQRIYYRSRTFPSVRGKCNSIIAVSDFLARRLISVGVPSAQVTVVRNGIELPDVSPRTQSTRQTINIGLVGQFLPRKQQHVAIEAFRLLRRSRAFRENEITLNLYGRYDTPYAGQVQDQVRIAELQNHVSFKGHTSSRHDIYRDMDVLIVPSIDDPFPTVALEAGAYGVPVVAASSGGLPEIVKHGRTGLLVRPQDPQAFADALLMLATNATMRSTLGQCAAARVREEFSVGSMAKRFINAIMATSANAKKVR
jgi:glycosyltransferase involved in cell wall biosynthesis